MAIIYKPYLSRAYRDDIQGIRAVGAILIMVYHLWMNKVSGGVDVFFVVSGFFMANMLLAQLASEDKVRPFVFWGKIVQRIAPSAYVVLISTLLLSYFFIPETQWINLANEALASAFHVENIYLMHTSVDYLARQEPPSAVQQFWALSIQVQFYFVLPIVFFIAAKFSSLFRSIYPLLVTICIILTLSFIYSLLITSRTPDSAYFNPLARLWEFFAGVLIAVAVPHIKLGTQFRNLMGLVGLIGLLAGGLLIPRSANFPGYIALVPVAAAICLIISGSGAGITAAGRLLSHRYLVTIGSVSFTIYLWHWPLMVFYLESTGADSVSLPAGLLIILGSMTLAFLTKFLVEDNIKKISVAQNQRLTPYLIATVFFIPAAGMAGVLKLHFDRLTDSWQMHQDGYFEGHYIQAQPDASSVSYIEFLVAKSVLPDSYPDSCHQRTQFAEVISCAYGDTDASVTIALVGGSHATQWLPALDNIGREHNIKVLNITKSHCPLGALEGAHASCIEWNQKVIEYLNKVQPAAVLTNSTRAGAQGEPEYLPQAYIDQWQALAEMNIGVIGIRDNPQFAFDPVHCVVRNRSDALKCSVARSKALLEQDPALSAKTQVDQLRLVDMSNYFCTNKICPTVFDDMLMYRDREHISISYVHYLTGKLLTQLQAVSPQVFGQTKIGASADKTRH